jgi:serine/threonine protein kinase
MEFLHSHQVVHFDLNCENMLADLSDPMCPHIKIADLGLSKRSVTPNPPKCKMTVRGMMPSTVAQLALETNMNVNRMDRTGKINFPFNANRGRQ